MSKVHRTGNATQRQRLQRLPVEDCKPFKYALRQQG